jgi:hypothetical protein
VRLKKPILEIATEDGFINITADEISGVPDEYLKRWRISRAQLHHCFNRGQELMERYKPADRVRPCAEETWDGKRGGPHRPVFTVQRPGDGDG